VTPGQYELTLRPDGSAVQPFTTKTVELHHRGDSIPISLPPRRSLVVELSQKRQFSGRPTHLPDLAAAPSAKKGTGPICRNGPEGASHKLDLSPFLRLTWDIYNLGPAPAKNVEVRLLLADKIVQTRAIDLVPPLHDYQNGVARVTFDPPAAGPLAIVIDPDDRIDEITELNNRAVIVGECE